VPDATKKPPPPPGAEGLGEVGAFAAADFAAAMAGLGPFEPAPRLAAAVSGGPDSMALAILAADWSRANAGSLFALIVDHGLRPESGMEATTARDRLAARGIPAKVLTLQGLATGPALAERARRARYDALATACHEADILHLLLGHQLADQAETVLIRSLSASGAGGLAAMAPLVETPMLRLLRPLLAVPPAHLRALLAQHGIDWAEDPSNRNPHFLRPRLRLLRRDHGGIGAATVALGEAASAAARRRADQADAVARCLAERVAFHPEGYAVLSPPLPPAALAAVVQAISGARYPPATASLQALARQLRPATLAGARLLPAGRLGDGLLAVREEAAMAPPVEARNGAIWDNRFRLIGSLPGATLGPLGADAPHYRRTSSLPSAVLRCLPAIRRGGEIIGVPHLSPVPGIGVVYSPPSAASRPIGDA
jgi:tRNA(Ile)-lysidine synthase